MGISKPKKILVVTSTFPRWINDTEPPFVMELCKRLVKLGFEIDVLAPHAKGAKRHDATDGITINRYIYCIPEFEVLAYSGGIMANIHKNKSLYILVPFFIFAQALAICRQIKSTEYEAIHAHWIFPQGFLCVLICKLVRKKSIPVLCTSHGGDLFSLQSGVFKVIKKWTLERVKKVTVVSNYMREYCLEKLSINARKIKVIPMGVDIVKLFKPVNNVDRKNDRLIFVGRLVEKKGVIYLIEAMALVCKQMPNVELVLVGGGPLRDQLEKKIKEHKLEKNISIIGSVGQKELPALYSSASIAVTPSIVDLTGDQEGLGLVIIEALACGCVVIASELEAIKDVITNGVNGVLVKPADPSALADAIQSLLYDNNRLFQFAGHARQSVVDKFDWDVIAGKYAELLHSLS